MEMRTELMQTLDDHRQRVQPELDGSAEGPTLAEEVHTGALGGLAGEASDALAAAYMFALEWDIDKARAVQLLTDSFERSTPLGSLACTSGGPRADSS
jgi:hypothetical protein